MPRITNQRNAELIAILSDYSTFLSEDNYQTKDLNLIMDICGKANSTVMSYGLFDLKRDFIPTQDPILMAQHFKKVMTRNVVFFQDELGQLTPFLIRCLGKQLPLLNTFMLNLKPEEFTDIRRMGLYKMRNSMVSIYFSALETLNNKMIKKVHQLALLDALADVAVLFSSSLPPEQRQQILFAAQSIQIDDSNEFKKYIEKIINTMSSMNYNTLCGL